MIATPRCIVSDEERFIQWLREEFCDSTTWGYSVCGSVDGFGKAVEMTITLSLYFTQNCNEPPLIGQVAG